MGKIAEITDWDGMSKRLCGLLTIRLSWQFASTLPLPTGAVPALAALVSHGTDSTNSEK